MLDLTPTNVLNGLDTHIPQTVRCFPQVNSTMDLCREALQQEPDSHFPLLIVADEQTAGRGRQGRRWEAPPSSALLFSLAFRPPRLPFANAPRCVWMASVAIAEGIAAACGVTPSLKWPNDILLPAPKDESYGGPWRKIAGILLEASSNFAEVDWAIIGCGINLSAAPPSKATRLPASHLSRYTANLDRVELLRDILRRFDAWYPALSGDDSALFSAWRDRLITIGHDVAINTPNGVIHGRAEAVDRAGNLLVRGSSGVLQTITSGDVDLVGVRRA